jgi:fructose-1,6-bisphosphatase
LINCKDELNPKGFKSGTFNIDADSIVFVTSDALAHYVLMMFEVANSQQYDKELSNAEQSHTKNENFIKSAKGLRKIDFEKEVIKKLNNSSSNSTNFERHISSLLRKGLIAYDDYSIAILKK